MIVAGSDTSARTGESFNTGQGVAPDLIVEWTPPIGSTNTTSTEPTTTTTTNATSATTITPTTTTTRPPPSSTGTPTPADYGFPSCTGSGRSVVRPLPVGTVLPTRWRATAPPDDVTYDLSGVLSTAQPSSSYPFAFGTGNDGADAGLRTCFIGGELLDQFGDPPAITWREAHDTYNASCVKGVALEWYQILDTVCHGIEDGFRPQESGVNANNTRFVISDTYLGNVLDDCLENDYTTEGVVMDSLWESCLNGVSERPSGSRCWETPPGETLVLDHLLLGLRPLEKEEGWGYGRLFKFAKCAEDGNPRTHNDLVIRCSTFLVPDYRFPEGTDGMEVPPGTTVDDRACPNDPTTIVWLGGGSTYPGDLRGLPIRTLTNKSYWDAKVAAWKAAH